ncbi:MAG: hypothetical protein CR972_00955 [Candidatus Moraniibacteriota bacterium]|nr:MAG: hypothetical protein CR972_00955 [Candidatus Moranbacteria bacterium]
MQVQKNSDSVLDDNKIRIGNMRIGMFTGSFVLEDCERDRVIKTCKKIWRHLRRERRYGVDPMGLHRFDLVPAFARSDDLVAENLGGLYIKGIYEVNGHSPECLAAASMIRHHYPHIPCVNAAEIVAERILDVYGDVPIAFVVGQGSALKASWYQYLVNDLVAAGLNITIMTPKEVMKKKMKHMWRWGDARINGENDYVFSRGFVEWLHTQNEHIIFNRVLRTEDDVTNKSLLLSSSDPDVAILLGENRPLDNNSIWWSVDQHDHQRLMAKPDGGSSGKGLIFGEQHPTTAWIDELQKVLKGGKQKYSLWETQWLPSVTIDGEDFAIDFNPAFWIDGDDIEYLYTIIRVDFYERYRQERKINVSQGAGIAGLIY